MADEPREMPGEGARGPLSTPPAKKPSKARAKELHAEALDHFRLVHDAESDQRKRENEDLAFDNGDQWPAAVKAQRAEQRDPATGKTVPARPMLTIPLLDLPINQTINQYRQANIAVTIRPKSGGATKKLADAINGLIRHIQVESNAGIAREWAFSRAVKCGRGYYRVLKAYANDGDFDQDLIISKILNQGSVYLDPYHSQPDGADAEWALIVEDVPWRRFKRDYPKSKVIESAALAGDLDALDADAPGWITYADDAGGRTANDIKAVRVAEYWYVKYEDTEVVLTESGWTGKASEAPEGEPVTDRRTVKARTVKWAKLTPTEIVEERDWEGRYIPLVQVVGREYNVKGKRAFKGIVAHSKDAARSYNYMYSKQVEAVGLSPLAPYVMAEGQDEGYEAMWESANTIPYSRLLYKPQVLAGTLMGPPQRTQASPDIGAITIAAAESKENVKAITGFSDPSLGKSNPADRSAKQVIALRQATEQGNSDYLDSLSTVSMVHEGRILLDLLPYVYDRPGRVATILEDDLQTTHQVVLGQPFVPGHEGRPPMPVPEEIPAGMQPPGTQTIDLKRGVYRVVVTVGKSFKTQREEAVALLSDLINSAPGAAAIVTDVLVENVDAPGFDKLAKRFKALLPPPVQAVEMQNANLPPEAQAALAGMQAQMQQMQQQMQQMGQELQSKKADNDTKLQIEQMKLQSEQQIKMAEIQMEREIETMKIQAGMQTAQGKAQLDAGKLQTAQEKLRQDAALAAAKERGAMARQEFSSLSQRVGQESELRERAIEHDTQLAHDRAVAELDAAVALKTKQNGNPAS